MPFVQGTTDPTKGTVSQKGTKTNLAEEALASDRSELSQNSWEGFRQWLKDTWDTIAWWWQKAWTKLTSARDFDLDKAIELRETENYLAGIDYTKLTDEWKKEYDNVQDNLIKEWSTVAPYKIDIDKMNETVDNIINSNTYQKAKAVAEKNETEPTYKVDLSKKLKTAFYADVLNGADKKDRFFYNTENWWYTTYKPEETGMIVDEVYNALESRALWWAIDAIAETEDRIREGKPYNAKAYERAKEQYTDLKDFAIYAVNNSEKLEDFWDLVQAYKEETWKNPLVTTNEFWLNENSGTFYSRQFLREDLLDPNLNSWYKIASGIWYFFNAVWTVFDQWMAFWTWAKNTVKDIFDDWILFNWNVAKDYELFDNMEFNSIYDSLAKNESWLASARKIAYQVYDRIPDVLSMIWSSPKLFGRTDKILDTLLEQWVRDSAKKFAGTYEKTTEWLTKAIEWIEQLKKGWYITQQVFKTILKDWILDNVVANAALKWNEYREYTPEDLLFDIWWSIVFDWLFMSLRLAKAGDVLTKNKWLFKQELAKKHFWINDWDRNMMSNDDKIELGRFMDAIVDTTKMTDQMTVKRVEAMKKLVKQQYKDIDSAVDEIMKNAKYQWQKIIDFAANSKKWSNYVTKDANGNNVLKWSLSLDDTLTLRRDYIKDRWKKFDSYIKDKTYQWSRVAAVKESIREEWLTIDWIKKWWNKFKSLKEEAQKDFLSDMWLNMSPYDQHVFDVWKIKNKLKDATKPTELYAQLQTFKNVLSLHKRELRAQWLARTDWVLRNESALLTKSKTIAERWKDIVLRKMRRSRDPVYSAWHIKDWEDTKFLLTNQVKNNWEEFLAKIFDVIEWTVPPQELELWLYCDPIMRRQWNEFHFRADSMISNWANWWWRYFNNPLEIAYFVWVEWKIKLPMPDWSERYLYYKMSWDNDPDWLASSIKYDVTDPLDDDFYTSFFIKADWQITKTDWLSDYLVPHWDSWDEDLVWIFENWMNKWDSDFSVFDIEDSDYKKLIDILSTTVDDMTMWTSNDVRQLLEKEIEEVKDTQEFPTPNVDPKLTNTQETREVATEIVSEVNKVTDLWENSEVVTKEAKEEPISPKKKKELRAQRNALVWILKAVAWTKTNNPWFVDNWIIKKASMWWFIWNELYQDAIGKVPWLEELIDEPTYYRLQKLWNSRWYTTNDIQESLTKMMDMLLSKRYSVNAERWSFSISFNWGMKKNWKQQYFSEPSWIDEMWEYAWDKWTAIWYSVDKKTSELKEKEDKEWIKYTTWGKTYKDIHILQYRKTKDWYRLESPISKTSDEKYMDIKIVDTYGGKKLRLTWHNKPKADKNYKESSWAPRWTLVFMKDVDPQKLEVDVKKQFNISNVNEIKAQLTFNGKIPLDAEIKDTSTVKDIIDHYSKKFWISISDPRTTLSEIQTNINEDYISDVFEALRGNISQEVSDDALTAYIVEWLEWSDINALINDWRARYWIDPSMIDATDPTEYIRMKVFDDYWLIDAKPNSLLENIWNRTWKRIIDTRISKWDWLSPVEMANLSNDDINRIIKQWINIDNYVDILPEWDPLRTKLNSFWDKRLWFINRRIKSLRHQWIVYDNRREALKESVIKHHSIKKSIKWELKEWWNLTKEQIQEYRNLWKQIIQESVELRWMWTNIVQQQRALVNSPRLWRFVKSYVQWLWGNWNFKDFEQIFEYYNNIIDFDSLKFMEEFTDRMAKYAEDRNISNNVISKQKDIDKVSQLFWDKWEAKVSNILNSIISNNDERHDLAKILLWLTKNIEDLDVILRDKIMKPMWTYSPDKNNIVINWSLRWNFKRFEKTFLHELLHWIVQNWRHSPEHAKQLNDIFQWVKQSLFKKYWITDWNDLMIWEWDARYRKPTPLWVTLYWLYNLDEFVSELFTNPEFAKEIDNIDKSFFRKLADWIISLFTSNEKTSDAIKGKIIDILKNSDYDFDKIGKDVRNNNLKRWETNTKLWVPWNQDMSEFTKIQQQWVRDWSIIYDRDKGDFTFFAPNWQPSNLDKNWWIYARTEEVKKALSEMEAYQVDNNWEPTLDVLRAIREDKNVEAPKEVKDNIETHITTSKWSYAQRTRENARDSDVTIAFAYDFNTAWEKLTKNAAWDKYRSVDLNWLSYEEMRRAAYSIANELPAKWSAIINIAGNWMYTLAKHSTEWQEYYNKLLVEFLWCIESRAGIKLKIISWWQTWIDEAWIIAAQRLWLDWEVHTTSDYKFRWIDGKDVSDKDKFIERFVTKETDAPVEEAKDNVRKELNDKIVEKWKEIVSQSEPKSKPEFSDYNVNSFVLNHNRFFWENKSIPAVRWSVDWNPSHSFGNPFDWWTRWEYWVWEATKRFEEWLAWTNYQDVNPEQREWIINQINDWSLKWWPVVYYTKEIPQFRWYRYKDPNTWERNSIPVYPNDYSVKYYDWDHPNHAMILQRFINEWWPKIDNNNTTTIVKNSDDDRIRNTTKLRDNITVKVKDEPIVEWVTSDNSKAVEIKNDKAKEEIKANNDKIDLQDANPTPTADVNWWHLMWIIDDLKYEKWVSPFDKVKSFTIDKSAWNRDANWRLISWWDTWYKKYEDLFVKRADEIWDSFYKKFLSANKNWKTLVSRTVDKIKNTRKDADIIRKEDNMELMYIDLMALKAWVPLPEPRLNMYLTRFELPRDCTVDQLAKRIADYHYKNYWWISINWDWSRIRLNYNPTPSPLWSQDNILYNKAKSFWSIVVWLRSYFNEIKKVLPDQKKLKDKLYWDIADFFSKNFYEWDIAPIIKEKQRTIKELKNRIWYAIEKYEALQKGLKKFAARKAKIKPESKTRKELWERYRINIAWEELEKEIDELWKEIEKYKQEWRKLEIRFKEWISSKELSQAINELSAWYDKANKQLQWTIEEKNKKLNWAMWDIVQEENVDLWLWREHQEQELRNKDNTDYSKVRNIDTWLWKYSKLVPKADVDNWLWWGNLFKEFMDDNEFDIKEAFEKLRRYQILEKQYRKKNKELANEIYWYLWWVNGKTISASRPFQNWAFSDPNHPAIVFSKDNWKLISKELPESLSRFMNSVILYHDLPKVKWFWETNTAILNSNIKEFFWWLTQSDIAKWELQWWVEKFNDRLSKWPHRSRLFQKWAAIIDANTISNIEWEMLPVINAQMEQHWKYWIMVQWTNIDNIKSLDKDLRNAWFVRVKSTWKDPFIFALQNEWYMYVPNEVDIKAAESRAKRHVKMDTSSVAETCNRALIEEAVSWLSQIEDIE